MTHPAFLLKISDGGHYVTVAGLRVQKQQITTNSLHIVAEGVCTGRSGEQQLTLYAMGDDPVDLELSFDTGARYQAKFNLESMEYTGTFNGERMYKFALSSVGDVTCCIR